MAQASFYSANDRRLHFGLGAATSADLTIRWPNGAIETLERVEADQLIVVREGSGIQRTAEVRKMSSHQDRGVGRSRCCSRANCRPRRRARPTSTIDATSAEGRISPLLYGQFIEFMFEGVKYGLHAELLRDRGFEDSREPGWPLTPHGSAIPTIATMTTLSRPGAMTTMAYPDTQRSDGTTGGHSLRVDLKQGVVERHGVYQARVPIRQGIEYRGYLWMKTGTVCRCGHGRARGRYRRRAGLRRDAHCESRW